MTVAVLLCDADGNLFPSEEPAFEASCEVTNRLLASLGIDRRFSPDELRTAAMGRNFRATAAALATAYGKAIPEEELDRRVSEERREVIAHLRRVLAPDPDVSEPLRHLAQVTRLAVVSSSATERLDACFEVTGLDDLLPAELRFSAEDSLPVPTSKPDPAIYLHAVERLGVEPAAALAVEDSVTGVESAVGAGVPVVGNLVFVAPGERASREAALRAAGAHDVVADWWELAGQLRPGADARAASGAAGGDPRASRRSESRCTDAATARETAS